MLSEAEQTYLRGLNSPHWKTILEKLKEFNPLPRYKPGMSHEDWVYWSGRNDAAEGIVTVLSGKLDLEGNDGR